LKNKKLFAILTLVCFMFTLMPVAAFADGTTAANTYDTDQVYVTVGADIINDGVTNGEETEVEISDSTTATFNAFVGNGASVTASGYVFYVMNDADNYIAVNNDGAFGALVAEGDYTVHAIKINPAKPGAENIATELSKVTSVESKVKNILAWAGANAVVNGTAEVTVDAIDYVYQIVLDEYTKNGYSATSVDPVAGAVDKYSMSIEASEGFNKDGQVVATLYKAPKSEYAPLSADDKATYKATLTNWTEVKNQTLTISEAGYVDVTADTLKTNNKGQVVFVVTSDFANTGNKVIVKFGTAAKAELTVNATAAVVANVAVNNEPAAPRNNESAIINANVEFKFADANGVATDLSVYTTPVPADQSADGVIDAAELALNEVAITVVEKPVGSNVKADKFSLVKQVANPSAYINADAPGVYTLDYNSGDTFDKDGTYVIKVAMKNGSSATATIKVAEMGDAVAIMFTAAPKTVAYGETVQVGPVVAVDANGVTTSVSPELSASGLAVDEFDGVSLVAKDDEDYVGETITLLAVYEDFVATANVAVVNRQL